MMTGLHLVSLLIVLISAKFAIDGECTVASAIGWLTLIIVLAVASVWRVV